MRNFSKNNNLAFLGAMLLLIMFFLSPVSASDKKNPLRIAVFPFNDIQSQSLNFKISSILENELMRYEFIRVLPVEIVREKIYEIDPAFLWTEKKGMKKRGGILWKVEPLIIEEINKNISADYYVFGDFITIENEWKLDAYISGNKITGEKIPFAMQGTTYEEFPVKLKELAILIADWLKYRYTIEEAETDIRRYMGNLFTHSHVVDKIRKYINSYPESIPLRALLMDLYLKKKDVFSRELFNEGVQIVNLLNSSTADDTRYLMSLSLDPYDVIAGMHEKNEDWANAIKLRSRAIQRFPGNSEKHRRMLGNDYFFKASALEKAGQKSEALKNYKEAMHYLNSRSEFYDRSREGLNRLR
jgi:tetratricopeptide (TPR) repeat protein